MRNHHNSGYTLIETMIAMTLAVSSLTAVSTAVGYGIGINGQLINSSRLNEELGNAYALMVSDLRRSGYSGDTERLLSDPLAAKPFHGQLSTGQYAGESNNSCVIFSYDSNSNGVLDEDNPNEYFGYRLRDGSIEIRRNGATCEASGWEDLTDNEVVRITQLTFLLEETEHNGVRAQAISLWIEGELIGNSLISRSYRTTLMVRNYAS